MKSKEQFLIFEDATKSSIDYKYVSGVDDYKGEKAEVMVIINK